jgi:hypothetical protein
VVGAPIGGIAQDKTSRFEANVIEEKHPRMPIRARSWPAPNLPATGVTHYHVPAEYGGTEIHDHQRSHRVVEPRTRKFVQIIG